MVFDAYGIILRNSRFQEKRVYDKRESEYKKFLFSALQQKIEHFATSFLHVAAGPTIDLRREESY